MKEISIRQIDKKLYEDWTKLHTISNNFVSKEDRNNLSSSLIKRIESELYKSRVSILQAKERHCAIANAIRYLHIYAYLNDVNLDKFIGISLNSEDANV